MNHNKMILIYTMLTVLLMASSVLLALQMRQIMYEYEDPTADLALRLKDPDDIVVKIKKNEADQRKETLMTFSQTTCFRAIATPIPRPTPTPIPPPTPTPVIPAKNWKVEFASKNMAILVKYNGEYKTVKIGQKVRDEVFGDFEVLELDPNLDSPRVRVRHLQAGTESWIDEKPASK